jgi:hypothetical protein
VISANFAIGDPPLKLVLNSPGNGPGARQLPGMVRGAAVKGLRGTQGPG